MILKQKNTINVRSDISFTVIYRFNCRDNINFVQIKKKIMAKKKTPPPPKRNSLRTHRHICTLNDEENRALNRYMAKYKVQNKSKFIRETLMIAIIRKLELDHPTLFD